MTAAFVGCVGDCRLFVGCCFSHQDPVRDRDKGAMSVCRLLFQCPFFLPLSAGFFVETQKTADIADKRPNPLQ